MFYEDDDIMVVRFGSGDVGIMPGVEQGTGFGAVCLADHCGKCMPINKVIWADDEWRQLLEKNRIKNDRDMNTMIRFVFEKPESIDCFIWALEEAKKTLLEKDKTE